MVDIDEYREEMTNEIVEVMEQADFQPALLVGSGVSIRYFGGPSWDELLEDMAEECPTLGHDYGYYRQDQTQQEIGQFLAEQYATWAWNTKEPEFTTESIDHSQPKDIYIKSKISDYFDELTPASSSDLVDDIVDGDLTADEAREEIKLLKQIQPHAIITTNYDPFLERIFNEHIAEDEPDYDVIIGEEVLKRQHQTIGEILKIHGCITEPQGLVLTSEDYREFNSRRRYLSSKMLTYFVEHPLLIIGYGAGDSNIQKVFSWVNQMLPENEDIADNIYFLEFDEDIEDRDQVPHRKQIQIAEGDNISINRIVAKDFSWVFKAFSQSDGLNIPIGSLRRILASTFEVVSKRAPDREVVDHQKIESLAKNENELATVLGIAPETQSTVQFDHNLRPSDVAEQLGFSPTNTYQVNELIRSIEGETGINIRKFNNRYHIAFVGQGKVDPRRYSEEVVPLLKKVRDGEEYSLDIPENQIPDES